MGLVTPFAMPQGSEPKPSIQGPTLTGQGQDSNLVKIPASYLGPSATAMPLIGCPAHSTTAGLDTDVNTAEDLILKPIARGKTKSVGHIPLYSLGSTPIVYNHLCIEIDSYPIQNDKLQLIKGLKFGFPLQYAGPRIYFEAKNLKSARHAPQIAVGLVPKKEGIFV